MVDCLESIVSLAEHNISFDRLYTSIPLALWLHQKNITSLGNMQIKRKEIPTEMKDVKQREPLSTDIYWQKDDPLLLSSCCQILSQYWVPQKMIVATNWGCISCMISQRVVQILLTSAWDFTRRKQNLESEPW